MCCPAHASLRYVSMLCTSRISRLILRKASLKNTMRYNFSSNPQQKRLTKQATAWHAKGQLRCFCQGNDKHNSSSNSPRQQKPNELLQLAARSLPLCLLAAPAHAAADMGGALPLALGGGVAITALSAALVATDPANRRKKQTADSGGNEKDAVRKYFNTQGFERWNKIYGQTDDVNKVQLDIREGHAQTVDKVLGWLGSGVAGQTVCDAGCGTGSLAIPLALRGGTVSASDISQSMAEEAKRRYEKAVSEGANAPVKAPEFNTSDLESLSGRYDIVTCLDVMIHYPQEDADKMIKHLASLANKKLIISFAPKTLQYTILKRIGELFPGPAKATRAYLHAEADVEKALNQAGFKVQRRELTATSFYFSRLLEAERQ